MIKMKLEIIPTKGILYDKCENLEQLYDNYYFPLLVEFKELQKQNADLKERYNNTFECHCNRVQVEKLQNNWNELNKSIENKIEELKNTIFETSLIIEDIDLVLLRARLNAYEDMLSKMQELEQGKDES